MVLNDQVILHSFHNDEMGPFSRQVNEFANLKSVFYPYKSALKFSYYMLIGEPKLKKGNA